ncbi:MAG: hypothetical protein WCL54_01065 [Clostridia bacterium]
MKKISDWIGNRLSDGLSSMVMFYAVTFLVLLPLLFQRPDSFITWIQYLSTAVLQAAALPLLGYTTKRSGDIQAKILQETHDSVMNELEIIKTQQVDDKKIMESQQKIILELKDIIKEIHTNTKD